MHRVLQKCVYIQKSTYQPSGHFVFKHTSIGMGVLVTSYWGYTHYVMKMASACSVLWYFVKSLHH